MKTEPRTLPALPSANKSGFPYPRITRMKAARGPITFEEYELFHLYDKLANPWSEMSSLTKHSKTMTLSLSFSLSSGICSFLIVVSQRTQVLHVAPPNLYIKKCLKNSRENSKFTQAKTLVYQVYHMALVLLISKGKLNLVFNYKIPLFLPNYFPFIYFISNLK